MIVHEQQPTINTGGRWNGIAPASYIRTSSVFFGHQAGGVSGLGGGLSDGVDVGGAGGDNKIGENSGGIKFAQTS